MAMTVLTLQQARAALAQSPQIAARRLLGAQLHGTDGVIVRIVEVEAYGSVGEDPASHAYRGPTPRNEAMFGPVGSLYAYRSYGIHVCLNVVAHEAGAAGGVLLRAGQVMANREEARRSRPHLAAKQLASGPGRLGEAVGYSVADAGMDLLTNGLLQLPAAPVAEVTLGPRVGISKAVDQPWRFWITGAEEVTRYRAGKKLS
ncbi:MAG: DNA-3-methyladenine glycosylase [Actinomycetia bacterium]|nr:DNA-3-methyladenine glycosylase [Actinomycetes bacterium]MCH9801575.1 DNA-3-methyladenine glycosylase [Actinomycetes bacterium]